MTVANIPITKLISSEEIPGDERFAGMKIVRYQSDEQARLAYDANRYEFQHEGAKRHIIPGVILALKGAPPNYRITAMMHPTLRQFTEIVKYDPSSPPLEDYEALGMQEAHAQTQSDFKGAKKENLNNFKQYNIEAIRGDRLAYLPPVSGWQPESVFDDTIFVALDESNPMSQYGVLYLPKKPVMQSDGQTQTAALFQAAATGLAIKSGALDNFGTTLEIELNVTPTRAGQSFADRNGRGSKKNKNLVAMLDNASALALLREQAVKGTIFEGRLADGRTVGATETATKNIVDLSTMEQMLLNVISRGTRKSEQVKHYHIDKFAPYCREFLQMLEQQFGEQWADPSPKASEPYRRIYIHGWAFALKALALAYHDSRIDQLHPLLAAMSISGKDAHETAKEAEENYNNAVQEELDAEQAKDPDKRTKPIVSYDELVERLSKIDWHRYRQHWIAITGYKVGRDGNKKTRIIKDGEGGTLEIVEGKAENTAATIGAVVKKIQSASWTDLRSDANARVSRR